MRFGRTSKAVGVAAVAALALGACASTEGGGEAEDTGGDGGGSTQAAGGVVSVAEVNPFTSFNPHTAAGNVDINNKVSYLTGSGFYYVNNEPEVVRQEDFGTYEVTSEEPFTVEYTVNEGVSWSDGNAIDAGDLLLAWAAQSGHFDGEDAEAETGTTYFSPAGSTQGLGLTDLPEISNDGRTMTLVYSEPYADWEIAYGVIDPPPAHVVAEGAGLADEQALVDLIMSTTEGDPENPQDRPELQQVADFWNTGFETTTLPSNSGLYLSSGPYIVDSMTADQSMTLVRNPDYNWGPQPNMDEITIRYIGDAVAQVQALQNGDVDVIQPQASADTLQSLEEIDGINILRGDELSYDHTDLNYSGVFEDENVRKAFMHTIPRDQIVESTIALIDPEADHRDSNLFDVGTPGYEQAAPVNGSENYDEANIEMARELLDGATPEVRLMYSVDNPNRVDAFTLIAESAEQAGFQVIDGGLPGTEWGAALGTGSYDATIFGWVSPGVGVAGVPQIYGCGSASNYNDFCDEEAQEAIDELIVTADEERQIELQTVVDTRLFETGYGLPLFQSIGLNAANDNIENIEYNPAQNGVLWNFWEWSIVE